MIDVLCDTLVPSDIEVIKGTTNSTGQNTTWNIDRNILYHVKYKNATREALLRTLHRIKYEISTKVILLFRCRVTMFTWTIKEIFKALDG